MFVGPREFETRTRRRNPERAPSPRDQGCLQVDPRQHLSSTLRRLRQIQVRVTRWAEMAVLMHQGRVAGALTMVSMASASKLLTTPEVRLERLVEWVGAMPLVHRSYLALGV